VRRAAESIFTTAKNAALKAFEVIQTTANRYFGTAETNRKDPERIWTESEIQDLVMRGETVPGDAAPYVRTLTLGQRWETRTTMQDAASLRSLTELRRLTIFAKNQMDLSAIGSLRQLEAIEIDANGSIDVSALADLPNLRSIELSSGYGNRAPMSFPQKVNWPSLSHISIEGAVIGKIPDLSGSTKLKSVEVKRCTIAAEDIPVFRNATHLTLNSVVLANLEFVQMFDRIQELDVRTCSIITLWGIQLAPKRSNASRCRGA